MQQYSNLSQQVRPKCNKNGEKIVFEGIYDSSFRTNILLTVMFVGVTIATGGLLLLCIPCIIAAAMWPPKLYITQTALHQCYGTVCQSDDVTPFLDIDEIHVVPGTNNIEIGRKDGTYSKIENVANCDEFVMAVKNEMACCNQLQNVSQLIRASSIELKNSNII